MKRFAIGADIGGSHISCALVDMSEGHIIKGSFVEKRIDNQAGSEIILRAWAEALRVIINAIGKENLAGIGFAMPGPFLYDQGIAKFDASVAKFEHLYDVNVARELAFKLDLYDSVPLRFMNDASAFAVGEAWVGTAANVSKSVSITLGTGFGSAFIENGIPVVERKGVPPMGRLWHLPFKHGIADDSFSSRWFISRWKEISGNEVNGVRPIAEEASSNPAAKALFTEYGQNIGSFLGPWLREFNAEVLVFGGNVSRAWNLFSKPLQTTLNKSGVTVNAAVSTLKESAAIIGSARMIDEEFWKSIVPALPKM